MTTYRSPLLSGTAACCARRTLIVALLTGLVITAAPASATVTLVFKDPAGLGFNDPTPVAPVPGNPGTTLGQQRRNAFKAAADYWDGLLGGSPEKRIEVSFVDDQFCSGGSGVLAVAGPLSFLADFPGNARANTLHSIALANARGGMDFDPGFNDIAAFFNRKIDQGCLGAGTGYWYGIGAGAPPGTISFETVARHEIGHGLGFATTVDRMTGAKFLGLDDTYSVNLEDHSTGKKWSAMSNAERKNSAVDDGDLHWVGPQVLAVLGSVTEGISGKHPQMFAPNPLQGGSSTSHWDTRISPNELMEPAINPDAADILTTPAMGDIGWPLKTSRKAPCVANATTLCLGTGKRFEVTVEYSTTTDVGKGGAVPFKSNSGFFYFFSANNIEMLIKVLEPCFDPFNRYWVFFAASTNVEFRVTVRDTVTGAVRVYFNPQGQKADAVTDTKAFDTCKKKSTSDPDRGIAEITELEDARYLLELVSAGSLTAELLAADSLTTQQLWEMARVHNETRGAQNEGVWNEGTGNEGAANPWDAAGAPSGVLGIQSAAGIDPVGTTYEVTLLGSQAGTLFTFQRVSPGDNVVTFGDGKTESLRQYISPLNTTPQVSDQVTDIAGNLVPDQSTNRANVVTGNKKRLQINVKSNDKKDLFPGGFVNSSNQQPIKDFAVFLGGFPGTDPLDFNNLGVANASVTLRKNAQTIGTFNLPPATFFPSVPWDGNLGILFADIAGRGVNDIELIINVNSAGGTVPPFPCKDTPIVDCLNKERFKTEVDFNDGTKSGKGMVAKIPGTTDSTAFWFFSPDNIEMIVKVLNACSFANRFWVFAAATTNVEYTLTVTDSKTGQFRTYFNPLGNAAPAITDTSAFATCP